MIRIVKLTLDPEKVEDFLKMFNEKKTHIRNFPGCNRLELLKNINQPGVFFTYSWWDSETDLNNYRDSELFQTTWAYTKTMFIGKPEAWSVEQEYILE